MALSKSVQFDLESYLAPTQSNRVPAEHRAWIDADIHKTLTKKQSGVMTYRSLDDVMGDDGFHAL